MNAAYALLGTALPPPTVGINPAAVDPAVIPEGVPLAQWVNTKAGIVKVMSPVPQYFKQTHYFKNYDPALSFSA